MQNNTRKNIHLPLSQELYESLQTESGRIHKPITHLVREAVEQWLLKRKQDRIEQEIFEYANTYAGITDLDPILEQASLEFLASQEESYESR